jgi:hypothetical protein
MKLHKDIILGSKFKQTSQEVFKKELVRIARRIIYSPDNDKFKVPTEISDLDMAKSEVLRMEHDVDYWREVKVNYKSYLVYRGVTRDHRSDATQSNSLTEEYEVPFAVYLVSSTDDLTPRQMELVS